MLQRLDMKGFGHVELWRAGRCIHESNFTNGITNIGKNTFLDVMFNGVTQITSWWIGIISNVGYSGVNASDIMTNHGGWLECTDIDSSTRLAWDPSAATGQQVVNSSVIAVTLTATNILQGIFIVSDSTKGGTAGIIWSTALFTSPLSAQDGDILKLTYAVQL